MDDPKVMMLDPKVFRAWIICLCLANEGKAGSGVIPAASVVAFKLRVPEATARKYMDEMIERGLIDVSGNVSTPHNWNARQYKSDVSTGRVQRFRERQKRVSGNGDETFQKRPQNTEYRIQNTDTPYPPLESIVERTTNDFRALHPKPSNEQAVAVFFAEHFHRLGEDSDKFAAWVAPVHRSHLAWVAHWALEGGKYATRLEAWLRDEGWTKQPPSLALQAQAASRNDDLPLWDAKAERERDEQLRREREMGAE